MRKLPILLMVLTVMSMISCDKGKNAADNPLLAEWDTPFGMPPFEQIEPSHYKPAFEVAIEQQLKDIDAIVANTEAPTFENTILAFDNSGELYNKIAPVFSGLNSAEAGDELKKLNQEMTPILSKHGDDLYLNEGLFKKVKEVYDSRLSSDLDSLQIRLTEKIYDRFARAGANLSAADKEILRKINGELALAQVRFGDNLRQAVNEFAMELDSADVVDLPGSIRIAAAETAEKRGKKGKYIFTLDTPSIFPFLSNSGREDLREKIYNGYVGQCNDDSQIDNKQTINDIIRLRTERARLMGYSNHAEYMLTTRMAKTPEAVYDLLNDLWEPTLNSAKSELEQMAKIKKRETGSDEFNAWDWWYYAEKLRKEKYDLKDDEIRPYFSINAVQAGIFELSNKLYRITFKPLANVPVYHKDCSVYEVLDENNSHLAVLILDFFPRAEKRGGAWCGAYRPRHYKNGERIDPIVTVVCNFTKPTKDKPALLSIDETETFFHEFGHALHNFFADVPYKGLLRVEQDFVELPSQVMENWAFEPQMLRRYATHYSSNAVIPDNLITKINNSALFNQGFRTTELVIAMFSDMDIHTLADGDKPFDVNALEKEMLYDKRGLISQIAPRYRYPYFRHIFTSESYSAGYYSYIWSEVFDKDAYEAFAETGDIFNRDVATAFRGEILSKGGSADGSVLYRNFRGKDADRVFLLYGRGLLARPIPAIDLDEIIWVDDTAIGSSDPILQINE